MRCSGLRAILLGLGAILTAGAAAQAGEILVSAAASLREAMQEAAQVHQAQSPGSKVALNFGASGALASQIEQGAPVDVFASANQEHLERLQRQDLLLPQTRAAMSRPMPWPSSSPATAPPWAGPRT